jgi:hypothetical protein
MEQQQQQTTTTTTTAAAAAAKCPATLELSPHQGPYFCCGLLPKPQMDWTGDATVQ